MTDRFQPTDEELISYLKRKVQGKPMVLDAIEELDVYNHEPSDLPEHARLNTNDQQEWFFFTTLAKYGLSGGYIKRGYWLQRGPDKEVKRGGDDGEVIGKVKRLVFNRDLPPTNWVIHEYHLVDNGHDLKTDAYVLCKVSYTSGNINAPLWDDDEKVQQVCVLNKEAPLPFIQYKRKRQIDPFGSYDQTTSETIPSVAAMLEESEPEPVDTTMVSTSSYTDLVINDLQKEKQQISAKKERYKLENDALCTD